MESAINSYSETAFIAAVVGMPTSLWYSLWFPCRITAFVLINLHFCLLVIIVSVENIIANE